MIDRGGTTTGDNACGPAPRSSRRAFLKLSGAALGAAVLGLTAARPASAAGVPWVDTPASLRGAQAGELVIYNWYQNWIKEVYPIFEQETGIKVIQLGTYSANSEWWAKIQAGESFDFCIPTTEWVQRGMAQGYFLPIDLSKVPNYSNIYRDFQHREIYIKDGGTYAVPFSRVYYALVWNYIEVPGTPDSWYACWDRQYAGKITMHDSSRAMTAIGALMLGDNPNRITKWNEIQALLMEQKPLVKKYWVDYQNGMELFVNKEVVIGELTSARAVNANDVGGTVSWTIPKEGGLVFVDCFGIPRTAKNVEHAHRFIDFLLRPDIMAKEMTLMRYDTVNEAAHKLLSDEDNRKLLPPEGAKLYIAEDVPQEMQKKMDDLWNEVKLS